MQFHPSIRPDRFVTLHIVRPLMRLGVLGSKPGIPILMYHSISEQGNSRVAPYYLTCTSPRRFAEHMALLHQWGFRSITLNELAVVLQRQKPSWRSHGNPPQASCHLSNANPRLFCLTFDDGYRDFLTHAWPVMQNHAFSGTVFLSTAYIGNQRRSFKGIDCLTWDEVRELRGQGVSFGSHTVNHPKLWDLSNDELQTELQRSREDIETELDEQIDSFAHPYAFPSANVLYIDRYRKVLSKCRYSFGVTTSVGCAHVGNDLLMLNRLPSNDLDDSALFEAKIHGEYDWLSRPQSILKRLKRLDAVKSRLFSCMVNNAPHT